MYFLTILLLTVGVTVAMAAGVILVSYALGQLFYTQEAGWPASASNEDRSRWEADAEWYAALPPWKQSVTAGWWLTNRVLWFVKGRR